MTRIGQQYWDIPDATRCWQKYDHNTRANIMSSHRVGHRQREAYGEFYYVHPFCPGVCFPTRADALRAAFGTLMGKVA